MAPGGYAWWYVDALSDDGQHGLALIAFVGSVFSPYYAAARRAGRTDPLRHCALNVALYGPRRQLWAMTERGAQSVQRAADWLRLGRSEIAWDGHALRACVDEIAVPLPRPLCGSIVIRPSAPPGDVRALDHTGAHRWRPLAPLARVEVDFRRPRLRWHGHAYVDTNCGDAPLEETFERWDWSRVHVDGNEPSTIVHYDVALRDGERRILTERFPGHAAQHGTDPVDGIWRTRWGLKCRAPAGPNDRTRVVRTLEDTPFYARCQIERSIDGRRHAGVHETLDLGRFRSRWVQALLPFRMPRRRG